MNNDDCNSHLDSDFTKEELVSVNVDVDNLINCLYRFRSVFVNLPRNMKNKNVLMIWKINVNLLKFIYFFSKPLKRFREKNNLSIRCTNNVTVRGQNVKGVSVRRKRNTVGVRVGRNVSVQGSCVKGVNVRR